MAARTFTSREFNREPGRIKRAAAEGPVVITERGKPIMAVLPYGAYERLTGTPPGTILDALSMEGVGEIEIDFPRPTTPPRAATFD
jgi:prevent-host-death family protein